MMLLHPETVAFQKGKTRKMERKSAHDPSPTLSERNLQDFMGLIPVSEDLDYVDLTLQFELPNSGGTELLALLKYDVAHRVRFLI
jgi:hypothetical protein